MKPYWKTEDPAQTTGARAGTAAIAAAAEVLQYAWDGQRERRRRNGPQERHHHPC